VFTSPEIGKSSRNAKRSIAWNAPTSLLAKIVVKHTHAIHSWLFAVESSCDGFERFPSDKGALWIGKKITSIKHIPLEQSADIAQQ